MEQHFCTMNMQQAARCIKLCYKCNWNILCCILFSVVAKIIIRRKPILRCFWFSCFCSNNISYFTGTVCLDIDCDKISKRMELNMIGIIFKKQIKCQQILPIPLGHTLLTDLKLFAKFQVYTNILKYWSHKKQEYICIFTCFKIWKKWKYSNKILNFRTEHCFLL